MAEFATTPPIPYVPIADKAAEVRAAVGLSPDTTGNTNLNAILAAGPAASRAAMEVGEHAAVSIVPLNARFVTEGDSITNPNLIAYPTQRSWVPIAADLKNFAGRTVNNVGVSGSTYTAMIARYASTVYPLRPTGDETVYLVTMIGSNDGGTSATTWISALESYWTTAKADGFTVVAITTPIYTANQNTLALAAAVRGSSVPDIIVDLGSVFLNSTDDLLWLSDDLHPTQLGATLIANAVNAGLEKSKTNPGRLPFVVASNGIGVGTNSPRGGAHAVAALPFVGGSSQTPSTIKTTSFGIEPYGASTDVIPGLLGGRTDATTTILYLGRAAPSANYAVTSIDFYAAANSTTTSGTLWGRVTGSGRWSFGSGANVGSSSTVSIIDTTASLRLSTTTAAQQASAQIALPAANNNVTAGSLAGELAINSPSGTGISFGTNTTGNTQTVRVRLKDNGALNFIPMAEPTGVAGDVYYDSSSNKLRCHNGTIWNDLF